jgi:hypothetical protein
LNKHPGLSISTVTGGTILSINPYKGGGLRGAASMTRFAREYLQDDSISEATVRGWIQKKRIRTRKFGQALVTTAEELARDLAGEKPAA